MDRSGGPRSFSAEVAENRPLGGGLCILELAVAGSTVAPLAGQFYQVECGGEKEHLLRRPLSVLGFAPGATARLSFLVEPVGWGTRKLCSMEAGDSVGLLGPLGKGFSMPDKGRALLVAGGVGVAPLVYLARALESEGVAYDFVAGFRGGDECFPDLDALASEVCVFTEDGSRGNSGRACDGLEGMLAEKEYSVACACGPEAMMAVAARCCEKSGVPCQVSLDSRMACGLGACRGCVKEGAGGKNLCVCLDGPVFDSREVAWRD